MVNEEPGRLAGVWEAPGSGCRGIGSVREEVCLHAGIGIRRIRFLRQLMAIPAYLASANYLTLNRIFKLIPILAFFA